MTRPLPVLNLRHLRAVAAIAETGSVSAAAKAIALSQPALTQGLAKIEASLGVTLFERRANGMTVTTAGALIAARTAEAFEHIGGGLRATRPRSGLANPERMVTMAQLRAVLALADAGSYVAAAAASGGSQPALHRAVRDVERLAGVALVERRGRGVAMTAAGRRAARGFRLAHGAIVTGAAEVRALTQGAGGGIVIGAMPLGRARLLPMAIATLHAASPAVSIQVIEGAHRELIDLLRDGRIDIMIGALRDPSPGPDVVQRRLFLDQLAIVARAGHPLAGKVTPFKDLVNYPWIVSSLGTPLRAEWESLFGGETKPVAPIECGSVMVIRGLLLDGDYLTLLSPAQVWVELEAGLLALVGPPLRDSTRTIGVTSRADWRPTAVQSAFVDMLDHIAKTRLIMTE